MLVIHFIGMPGSGKSAVASAFGELLHFFRSAVYFPITFIEMSDVVKEWMHRRPDETGSDLFATPLESPNLYNLLYSKVNEGVNIISGVREAFLLRTEGYDNRQHAVVKTVGLDASWEIRRHRVLSAGGNGSALAAAEGRALDMGVLSLIKNCDVVINYGKTLSPTRSVEDVARGIFSFLFLQKQGITPVWLYGGET